MKTFSEYESKLIFRALMLLSFVVDGRDSSTCMKLAEYFRSNFVASQMVEEDENI